MRGQHRIGTERFGGGYALLVRLSFLPRFFQRLYEQRTVFWIFRLALGGFAESGRGGSEIAGLHGEQAEIKRIVVLIGIEIVGTTKISLSRRGLATRFCDRRPTQPAGT